MSGMLYVTRGRGALPHPPPPRVPPASAERPQRRRQPSQRDVVAARRTGGVRQRRYAANRRPLGGIEDVGVSPDGAAQVLSGTPDRHPVARAVRRHLGVLVTPRVGGGVAVERGGGRPGGPLVRRPGHEDVVVRPDGAAQAVSGMPDRQPVAQSLSVALYSIPTSTPSGGRRLTGSMVLRNGGRSTTSGCQ